jgi:hypothetical protein
VSAKRFNRPQAASVGGLFHIKRTPGQRTAKTTQPTICPDAGFTPLVSTCDFVITAEAVIRVRLPKCFARDCNDAQSTTVLDPASEALKSPIDMRIEIRSALRECVDHIIVLVEVHLRRILKSYALYYNKTRTHLALDRMRPFLARLSEPVWSGHLPSWADFITTTSGVRFSVHTSKACTFAEEFVALF